MLQLRDLHKDYGEKIILNNINLTIYYGEKVGIIGNNGQGKSTLLNIISGDDKDYSGKCIVEGKVSCLKQSSFVDFSGLPLILEEKGRELLEWLKKLHFNGDLDKVDKLSGGERTKLAFAIAFLNNPDILLLDEPTNNLDLTGRNIITKIVNDFLGTVIVVSHDKQFLNQTVDKILKLSNGEIKCYVGNYDAYLLEEEKQKKNSEREYEKHKRRVEEIEENIRKVKEFARKSEKNVGKQDKGRGSSYMQTKTKAMVHAKKMNQQVANRITKLEKQLEKGPEKPLELAPIKYSLDVNPLKTKVAVKFSEVKFAFENKEIFENLSFEIFSGERVGLIGDNGAGKTTLLKLISNQLQIDSGEFFRPASLKIASMEQDILDLDDSKTITELSMNGDSTYRQNFLSNLVNMNIDKTRFNTKIKNLSLGERMRIKLNFIILSDANFIILDEPTNHLDIENKDFMEKTLSDFKGTILIVSHDLDFIEKICTKIYKIENKKLIEYHN